MDFRELHKIRIKNDYLRLSEMESGGLFTWEAIKGEPPYVEEYLFHIRVPGYVSPDERNDDWTIKIILSPDYPRVCAQTVMVGEKQIFHPHWWESNRRWSIGVWKPTTSLAELVSILLHSMAYDPMYTNPMSPCNNVAAKWYLDPANQHLFPTIQVDDYIKLPESKVLRL